MPAVPTREIGHVNAYADLNRTGGWPVDDTEESIDWQWPNSVATCDRMARNSQVRAVWWALTLPLRRAGLWALDPQDARPEVVDQIADDMDLPILDESGRVKPRAARRRRGRFSWADHVRLALLSLRYGHMAFCPVYDADALKETGQARLRKLSPRFPHTISDIKVDVDGMLTAIHQANPTGKTGDIRISVDELVFYSFERQGAAWQGTSIFRAAYGDFVMLDRLVRVRGMTIERNGMGVPWMEATVPDVDQATIDKANTMGANWRAGESSSAATPYGIRPHLLGVEGTLPDATPAISDHRAQIAKVVQATFMELGTNANASGHRALGETFMDFFAYALDGVGGFVADTATAYQVEDQVDLNWGPDEPAPAIVARPVDAETDLPVESLVELVRIGAVTMDDELESYLRTRYRLPRRGEGVARPVPSRAPSTVTAAREPRAIAAAATTHESYADRLANFYAPKVREALATTVDPAAIVAAYVPPADGQKDA